MGAPADRDALSSLKELAERWALAAVGTLTLVRDRGELTGLLHELGLATHAELGELDLRLAQLEHRLRLTEAELDRLRTQHSAERS